MNSKTISIVSGYSINLPAIKNRLIPLVESFQKKNFKVTIFSPCKSELHLKNDYGVSYVKLNLQEDLTENLLLRAFKELYKSMKLLNLAYKKNDQFIYIGTPSIFNLIFSRNKNSNHLLDIRDITWEYLPEKNFIFKNIKKLLKFFAIKKLKNFSVITCTNKSEFKYLKTKLKKSQILYYLPNGISSNLYKKVSNLRLRKRNKEVVVSYIGNIGKAQNLEILIKVAQQLPQLKFNIIGSGREFKKINKIVEEKKITNIFLPGRLPFENVLKIYEESDILYTQLTNKYSLAIPSKTYEYLATGKYIIFGGKGEINNLLEQFENFKIISSNNIKELKFYIEEAIKKNLIYCNSTINKELVQQKFIREKHCEVFINEIFN